MTDTQEDKVARFFEINSAALAARAEWLDESYDSDQRRTAAIERYTSKIAELTNEPSPIEDAVFNKWNWLTMLADDEREHGHFDDGRLFQIAASLERDCRHLHPKDDNILHELTRLKEIINSERKGHPYLNERLRRMIQAVQRKYERKYLI